MPSRRRSNQGRSPDSPKEGRRPLTAERLDLLLNRLFTQKLRQEEAEAILEELAPAAAELVPSLVNLLNSPDARTRETASQVLIHLRHPAVAVSVRRLLERPGASDAARLAAYATLEVMGEAPDAQALLGSLQNPESLFERSLDDLLASLTQDQHASEFWQSMNDVEPETRLEMLTSIGQRRDLRSRKLLSACLWDEHAEVALAAVEALQRLGDARVADSLLWLAEISRRPAVAEGARGAAVQIRVRSSARGEEPPLSTEIPECWASFIDGSGGQLLMAVREGTATRGGEGQRLASVFVSDQRGIVDASGSDSVTAVEIQEMRQWGSRGRANQAGVNRDGEQTDNGSEIGWVQVGPGYCQAAIEAARQLNRRDHRRLPGEWEFWRDTFEVVTMDESLALEPYSLSEERSRQRLADTAALIQLEGFQSWLLQLSDLAPFLPAALRGMARRPGEREPVLGVAVSSCLTSVMKTRQRRVWRSRLLRQAALWQRRGDSPVVELCLAAAWGLDERRGVASAEHPLLRAMTRASLEVALGR